ncbi:hypothetical protein KY290_022327 [Solanum tuberosum]|uniref:Uncharacterized protein n=1 Tax=Solanum tuberosum TaxID=4113 RepID=A0ABQ7V410_SOLTU|nr:hypothetical protein KY289_021449 [Solanum tuberosum]KAH0758834.1 hypothetical protein KY290_022327 [Solanum tuberosum]
MGVWEDGQGQYCNFKFTPSAILHYNTRLAFNYHLSIIPETDKFLFICTSNHSISSISSLSKGLIFGEVLANEFHISLLLYAMALCALKYT